MDEEPIEVAVPRAKFEELRAAGGGFVYRPACTRWCGEEVRVGRAVWIAREGFAVAEPLRGRVVAWHRSAAAAEMLEVLREFGPGAGLIGMAGIQLDGAEVAPW